MRTAHSLTVSWGGCLPRGVGDLPGGFLPGGGYLPRRVCLGSVCSGGWGCLPFDLSHNAFDVTCMLSLHQLRLITSAAAYIVFGHVTCDACWDTPPPPTEWQTRVKTLPFRKLRLQAVIKTLNTTQSFTLSIFETTKVSWDI